MRASKAKTKIRQEQLARAALKLLAVRGWQCISLAAIAREVGVVTSAVYRHYKCKDDVLNAVLDLVGASFQNNVQIARHTSADPVAQLHEILVRHVQLITDGVPVPRIVLSEDIFTGSARRRKKVQTIYQAYLGHVTDIIRHAQKQRCICGEPAAETLSLMWLGLVQSPAILWLLSKGGFDLQEHCERAWQVFIQGITTIDCCGDKRISGNGL